MPRPYARHRGIPYETGERLLQQLPEQLRELANQVLNGPVDVADLAYTLAALIDRIEHAAIDPNRRRHQTNHSMTWRRPAT